MVLELSSDGGDFKRMDEALLESLNKAFLAECEVSSDDFGPAEPAFLDSVTRMLRDLFAKADDRKKNSYAAQDLLDQKQDGGASKEQGGLCAIREGK